MGGNVWRVRSGCPDHLHTPGAAVHVIPKEQELGRRVLERIEIAQLVEVEVKVGEVAVDVPEDVDGGLQLQAQGVLLQDLVGVGAQVQQQLEEGAAAVVAHGHEGVVAVLPPVVVQDLYHRLGHFAGLHRDRDPSFEVSLWECAMRLWETDGP